MIVLSFIMWEFYSIILIRDYVEKGIVCIRYLIFKYDFYFEFSVNGNV